MFCREVDPKVKSVMFVVSKISRHEKKNNDNSTHLIFGRFPLLRSANEQPK